MTTGQINWASMQGHGPDQGVSTTLTINCRQDGSVHMETPPSQGGYSGDFQSPQDAAQEFTNLLQQGLKAGSNS